MSHEDTLGNIKTLDQWRAAIGLLYPVEKPEGLKNTVAGRPLSVRKDAAMKYGKIPGVTKKVSRLLMGVDNQRTLPHAAVMFDDFIERGGTAFDTAYVYGNGHTERLLGEWVKLRGVREDIVILDKGAHTPECFPEALTRQLFESLDRLQTDYLDIYMLHRDNTEVPVGEFVDVLNEHKDAGRVRAFGGSNWTPERMDAANRYAEEKGVTGFAALSNNFSLAEMIEAPWSGCISASDAETRSWLQERQMPLIAWSSQARGFFTDRSAPGKTDDAELVRCWYSDANFERKRRAEELA